MTNKKFLYYFVVVITYLLTYLICHSNATSYRKSNNSSRNLFPLSLIHINDFHARFEETNEQSAECKKYMNDTCIGGYSRIVTVVKRLQKTRTNPIYLNAGDNFAGTIWYIFGKWNVTAHFLNMLKADVMTIGNHEFDNGIENLAHFVDAVESPMILANADFSDEPQLQGKFSNSTILVRNGRKIGIIGVIAKDTDTLSNTENARFLDVIETVHNEAEKLERAGVSIILVLSHCGIIVDLEIARSIEAGSKIDVIIGAHSHTFMYTGDPPGPDKPEYDYPTVIEHSNGHKVLVVQASSFAKYVGDLTVYFNQNGEAIRWIGQPVFLASNVPQDPTILNEINLWRKQFEEIGRQVITTSEITLDADQRKYAECIMCDVVADAFLDSYHKMNDVKTTAIAFVQAGAVRVTLPKGPITYGDILTVLPFGNRVDSFELQGKYIWFAMERSVTELNQIHTNLDHMIHVSGMQIDVNTTEPLGKRIMSIRIKCEECSPVEYKPIDLNRFYRIVAPDFLAKGGNGYTIFAMHSQNYEFGEIDSNALRNYLNGIPKLEHVDGGRVHVVT